VVPLIVHRQSHTNNPGLCSPNTYGRVVNDCVYRRLRTYVVVPKQAKVTLSYSYDANLTRDELPNIDMLYAFTSPDFCADMVYTLCHHDPTQRGSGTYIRARKTSRRGAHGFY